MPTFFPSKLLPTAAGILLAAAAVISGSQAAVAANVGAVFTAASGQGSENLLLAQIGQLRQGTTSPSPSPGTARQVPLPVKIPEPSTVVGLGLVAGSLAVSRRRVRVKN
ncbi:MULTISPECIES: PEP-CTERM sorting domain-containing protein [unclassified Microcoleus]|uniref:PEP-CTERM sorting domain-containing protein n=1 Tax=unclassified Microcoleus TaxID=2642155 RepID=UPI002FD3387D